MEDSLDQKRRERWRLLLGSPAEEVLDQGLGPSWEGIDQSLSFLYESQQGRTGSLHRSRPQVARWLGDIRTYFSDQVVRVLQKDALDRLGLERMLMEPDILEIVQADVHLVATLIQLKDVMPEKTRETARMVVGELVADLQKKLRFPMMKALKGSLSRSHPTRNPKLQEIDWHRTIRKNLRHYQPRYQTIIPAQLVGRGKVGKRLKEIILCVDQSGSMASSVVYASIFASVMASLPSLDVKLLAFDTAVADLTEKLRDPVELLFGIQLGGGTDIHKAVTYGQQLIKRPKDCIFVLITDLYEGGNRAQLLRRVKEMKAEGVNLICLLALNDEGKPAYDVHLGQAFAHLRIPAFACTPDDFPSLMAEAIQNRQIKSR
ncbi:MAG: VWA domain-containing protein [Bacteroidota bacterium]